MNHEEHRIQVAAVKACRQRWPDLEKLLFAIPNGGHRATVSKFVRGKTITWCPEGKRLKDEGAVKGVWDLILAVSYGDYDDYVCGAIIEVKHQSQLTEEQEEWGAYMKMEHWKCFVGRTTQEIFDFVSEHMREAGYK